MIREVPGIHDITLVNQARRVDLQLTDPNNGLESSWWSANLVASSMLARLMQTDPRRIVRCEIRTPIRPRREVPRWYEVYVGRLNRSGGVAPSRPRTTSTGRCIYDDLC